ncbi:MAG: AraC family transcriptional regulator [Muribaculaceae bacterium]|nr:AraC family transcriptional regulator [Roseburia sp.]MCM1431507.1 AraC family transcriptional regulator [Muribaculaceae bacterium]MCM1493800.1 AraC family transcriptional regulator [Muribaculaceae bacterium]
MNILEYENYQENVTHGDIVFPYNTYLCSIPLDFPRVPLHWHEEIELVYAKKGTGLVTVDFRPYAVKSPSILLILPGQLHSIEQLGENSMEYENIMFHPSMLFPRQADSCGTDFLQPLISGKITVPTLFTPVYPYYEDLAAPVDACDEICKTKPQGYELYIKSQLFQFFFVLSNRCRNLSHSSANRKALDKMKVVLKYIENNYMNKIAIADVAASVDFSDSHFMRYFKDTMGTSFIEYLKDYRLTMASRLLTASDSAILDIAAEVGFDNLSYFNRAFKAKYNMTPSQFRRTPEPPEHH